MEPQKYARWLGLIVSLGICAGCAAAYTPPPLSVAMDAPWLRCRRSTAASLPGRLRPSALPGRARTTLSPGPAWPLAIVTNNN